MLFKRKNSQYWWYKFTDPSGRAVRNSTKTTDKRKARELADKHKALLWDQVQLGHRPIYLWEDAVVKWLSETDKKSVGDDVAMFRFIHPFFEGLPLEKVTRAEIEKVITAKSKTASSARVNRITALIRAVLRKAEREWEWIDKAPAIRRLKEPGKRIRWITQAEAERLFTELPDHLEPMARFSLSTGLREANVTGLQWNQVDLQRKVAWIHPDQAKARKAIGIPLNEDAVAVIRQNIGNHDTHIFTRNGKTVKKAGSTAWKKALKDAGIENFRWHDLRHTWASWHVQNGTPLNILQELGGWSSYEMVLRYAHLAPEHLAEYAANISSNNGHIFGHITTGGIKESVARNS